VATVNLGSELNTCPALRQYLTWFSNEYNCDDGDDDDDDDGLHSVLTSLSATDP